MCTGSVRCLPLLATSLRRLLKLTDFMPVVQRNHLHKKPLRAFEKPPLFALFVATAAEDRRHKHDAIKYLRHPRLSAATKNGQFELIRFEVGRSRQRPWKE
jgi:hypothetical protein